MTLTSGRMWSKAHNKDVIMDVKCGNDAEAVRGSSVSTHGSVTEGRNLEVDTHRVTLRTRAIDLSRDKTNPLNILELPTEILRGILSFLQAPGFVGGGGIDLGAKTLNQYSVNANYSSYRQNIQSARLVCRQFCTLASPLLFPILQIRLDQTSLHFADHVSKSPFLAAGVRTVQVVLQYYSARLAADLSLFKDHRLREAERWRTSCAATDEIWDIGCFDSDDDTVTELPRSEYRRGMDGYEKISGAWRGGGRDEESIEYRQILHRGHQVYRAKHQEQLRLLEDGSFARTVASIMAQLPLSSSLILTDQADLVDWAGGEVRVLLLTDKNELFRYITKPHQWRTIQTMETAQEVVSTLAPAKLLSELPIAVYKAGVVLREVHIAFFALIWNFITPGLQDPLPAWNDLQDACQNLEVFTFGKSGFGYTPTYPLAGLAKARFDRYLGAMLSGSCLRYLELHLGWDRQRQQGVHHVGRTLGAIKSSRIKMTTVMGVSLHQTELEAFCKGLGFGLEQVYLCGVQLLSGRWAGVLDILREKVSARCIEGTCKVYLRCLAGGEFGHGKMRGSFTYSFVVDGNDLECLSERYVSGFDGVENPLRRRALDIHRQPKVPEV